MKSRKKILKLSKIGQEFQKSGKIQQKKLKKSILKKKLQIFFFLRREKNAILLVFQY